MIPALRIGTAGWSYPHWNGVVYPKNRTGGFHPLDFLSKKFSLVEINSSFYQPLKPELASVWVHKVEANPDFQFTAKLQRRFTHERVLDPSEIDEFKRGLWPLLRAHKLGAVLMQFPWAFRFTPENQEFLIRLRRAFSEFPLVAEMRHASWLAEEALGTFLDYKIGFCNIDQPAYINAMPPTAYLTSGVGYVRLHGRSPDDALGGLAPGVGAQHDYLYSEAELAEWKKRIENIGRHAESTYVVLNNDAAGKSVVNALQLEALFSGRAASAPKELRRRFPLELERFRGFEQQCLFSAA